MVWWQKVYSEHWLEPGFLDHWRYFLNCQINKCIRTCWKQKPCTHGVWLMDKLNVMQCHFTCNHWAMPKKRPHQWISISMPCVPLLPMLVLGTCPHLDSFYALVNKQTEPRTEPSKHPPVHFYQSECFAKKTTCQETQSLQWAKTRNRAWKVSQQNLENVWKCRIKYNLFILLQRSQKKITQIPLMSFPGSLPQRPYRQPALRIHDMTTQPLATTQGARMNDLKQPFLGSFSFRWTFCLANLLSCLGINLRGMLLLCVLCGLDHQRFFVLGIWWGSQLVVETIIGKPGFEVEITHYAT